MAYTRHEDKIIKIVDKYPISDTEEKTDMQMEIRKVYKKAHILEMTTSTFQGMPADEVYRKAKAFEEILKIDNQATDEDRITGKYESDIETVLSEYKERTNDGR